jgi:hypothetical protein
MSAAGNYVTNVAAAIAGHEGFSSSHPDAGALLNTSMTVIVMYVVFMFLFSFGAGMLSYHYNLSIGTSGNMTVLYVFTAAFFSTFYYPYYALFLNPLAKTQRGGRR